MAKYSFDVAEKMESKVTSNNNFTKKEGKDDKHVGFFSLKNDGDYALVRFPYSSSDQFDIISVHNVKVGKFYRSINCLYDKNADNPVACPLCASGKYKPTLRFFVKLSEYTKDANDKITSACKIWNRSFGFSKQLKEYMADYGDISNMLFKIVRHGASGDMKTSYNLIPLKEDVFKPTDYVKDFSSFEGFKLCSYVILNKTADEMDEFLTTGEFPSKDNNFTTTATVTTPTTPTKAATSTNAYTKYASNYNVDVHNPNISKETNINYAAPSKAEAPEPQHYNRTWEEEYNNRSVNPAPNAQPVRSPVSNTPSNNLDNNTNSMQPKRRYNY